jgi:hypothetical protein
MYFAHPSAGERYYLRVLLNHVPGATCYDDLKRTDDGVVHPSFRTASVERGLVADDSEVRNTLTELISAAFPSQIREVFSYFLATGACSNPVAIWDDFKDNMTDDMILAYREQNGYAADRQLSHQALTVCEMKAFRRLDDCLRGQPGGKRLQDFFPADRIQGIEQITIDTMLIEDATKYGTLDELRARRDEQVSVQRQAHLTSYRVVNP